MPKPESFLIPQRDPATDQTIIEQQMIARKLTWRGKPSFSALARHLRQQTPPYKAGYRALANYVKRQSPDSVIPKRYPLEANARIIADFFGLPFEAVWKRVTWAVVE